MQLSTPNGASADDSVARIETTDMRRHITEPLLFLYILGDVLGGHLCACAGAGRDTGRCAVGIDVACLAIRVAYSRLLCLTCYPISGSWRLSLSPAA